MGCASSKPKKKQIYGEAGPPSKMVAGSRTFNSDIEDYHRQLLALTSGSGSAVARVDALDTAGGGQTDENGTGHADSLKHVFDKLGNLESAELVPKPWNEVSNMLETLKSAPEKENSCPTDFRVSENSETIDVGDIMDGLDDETPWGSSALQTASPETPQGPFLDTNAIASSPLTTKFAKAKMFIHTVDELDAQFGVSRDSNVGQRSNDSLNSARNSQTLAFGRRRVNPGQDGSVKENAKPRESTSRTTLGTRIVPSSTASKGPFLNPQVYSDSIPRLSPILGKESNANRKDTAENKSVPNDVSVSFRAGKFSNAADVKHSTTSRHENLPPLNEEKQKDLFTNTIGQPALTLEDSESERFQVTARESYFDSDLLNSYEKALQDHSEEDWNAVQVNHAELQQKDLRNYRVDAITKKLGASVEEKRFVQASVKWVPRESSGIPKLSSKPTVTKMEGKPQDPFEKFEERCPPGGEKAVVLYTTTLRGIRKTFEDCNNVREILQSFGLSIDQRDVSMHLQFRNELMELMGRLVSVPRLFIKGRYIGGQEEVAKLHENAKLSELIQGLPKQRSEGGNCDGCGGMRFIPCLECSGSCKIADKGKVERCPDCNENGLIQCPICS